MSAPINPPAFPGFQYESGCGPTKTVFGPNGEMRQEIHDPGMTLRDYFAAKALQGYSANAQVMSNAIYGWKESGGERPTCVAEYLAGLSYEVADAMLAERAKEAK